MPSPFDIAMASADAAIDKVMGDSEGFAFTPMRAPVDGAAVADGTRAAIANLAAVFDDAARTDEETYGGRTTTEPRLQALAIKFPQGVRRPDRITRLKDGALYEVRDVQPADIAGYRLTLFLHRINIDP